MNRGPTARDPQTANTPTEVGEADFEGQDGYDQPPDRQNVGVPVRKEHCPTIDDPSTKGKTTVYQSDDIRIHEIRSEVRGK